MAANYLLQEDGVSKIKIEGTVNDFLILENSTIDASTSNVNRRKLITMGVGK